jgi:hypothetical protein
VELVSRSREEQPHNNPISETPLPSPGHLASTPELVSSQKAAKAWQPIDFG